MVEEELDETNHWLEIIMRCGMLPVSKMDSLYKESQELLNIISKSIITTKAQIKSEEKSRLNSK